MLVDEFLRPRRALGQVSESFVMIFDEFLRSRRTLGQISESIGMVSDERNRPRGRASSESLVYEARPEGT
jgi:hypothetical protein